MKIRIIDVPEKIKTKWDNNVLKPVIPMYEQGVSFQGAVWRALSSLYWTTSSVVFRSNIRLVWCCLDGSCCHSSLICKLSRQNWLTEIQPRNKKPLNIPLLILPFFIDLTDIFNSTFYVFHIECNALSEVIKHGGFTWNKCWSGHTTNVPLYAIMEQSCLWLCLTRNLCWKL